MHMRDFQIRNVKSRLTPFNWELVYSPLNLMLGGLYDFTKNGVRRATLERVIFLILQNPDVIPTNLFEERNENSTLKQLELSGVRKLFHKAISEEV